MGRVLTMEVVGARARGRPARRLKDVVEHDMRVTGFEKGMASDRETWEDESIDRLTPASEENGWDNNHVSVCV